MWLYAILSRYFPERLAIVATALWFAVLIVAVLFSMSEPQAEFRYGNI